MSTTRNLNPLAVKLGLIALLTLVLLIPLRQTESLIAERSLMRDQAVARVASGLGREQIVGALMLVVPITNTWLDGDKQRTSVKTLHVLATSADITGAIATESRRSGIYTVPTYQARLQIKGTLATDELRKELASEPGVTKKAGAATLFMAVSDPRGIRTLDGIRMGTTILPVAPASEVGLQGVAADLSALDLSDPQALSFSVELAVAGTERLRVLPFAGITTVALQSSWPNPSFSGSFFPNVAPLVNAQGFRAKWQVGELNRNYPQSWHDGGVSPEQILKSGFGVDFYQPVDVYQRNYRAIHYAILFIALTFMGLFLCEHTIGPRVHAIQYAMIGGALSVFYLVLLALSEHVHFAVAYTLAAGALSTLLSAYFSGVLHSTRAGAGAGSIVAVCYSLLYLLVLSEEYALLFGALALFAVVAAILIGTRKLDWYQTAEIRRRPSGIEGGE